MSDVLQAPRPDTAGPEATATSAADPVAAELARLWPISLDELNAAAGLMTRVDRKYFVPREVFTRMLAHFRPETRVLEIDGCRTFDYHTVYFDTPEFAFFREHVQGRRRRHKVRTRTYRHSGQCLLEVKTKGYRGRTEKNRQPHEPTRASELMPESFTLLARHVDPRVDTRRLAAVLTTDYRRTTLVHESGTQRVTCDTDLVFHGGGRRGHGPDDVLVETKSERGAGPFDRWLLAAGVREHSVSKYCIAAALLYPQLRANRWHRLIRTRFAAWPEAAADWLDGRASCPRTGVDNSGLPFCY